MKKILILLLMIGIVFINGCADSINKAGILKSNSDIRAECLEQYRESHWDEKECTDKVCEELDLKWRGSGSWYYSTIDCATESGASIEIEICNTNFEPCQRVCDARINIQKCLIEQGAGYD